MFDSKRSLLWWRKSEREEAEEGFEQGFHDLPHPKKRASMSPEKLAILLSEQKVGTPAHILVEHELNRRIAYVQAEAATRASYVGIVGVVVGVVLTASATAWLQKTPAENPKTSQFATDRNADRPAKVGADLNVPTGPSAEMKGVPPTKQPGELQKANPKK